MKALRLILLLGFTFVSICISAQEQPVHVVAKGETISSIAQKYNVSETALIAENPILKNYIYVGMKIRLPKTDSEQGQIEMATVAQKSSQSISVAETISETKHDAPVVNEVLSATPSAEVEKKESTTVQRQSPDFMPQKIYHGLAFYLPTLENLNSSNSAWGIEATGFGYQFFLSQHFFLDASGHLLYRHARIKFSDEYESRNNEFAIHFPVMAGVEVSGFQLRAGGLLEYTIIGWNAVKDGKTVTRETYSSMKSSSPNRFHYGARFDVSFGIVNVGFMLSWQTGVKNSAKQLSIGFKF